MTAQWPDLKLVFLGGRGERDYVGSIVRQINHPNVVDLSGQLSVPSWPMCLACHGCW